MTADITAAVRQLLLDDIGIADAVANRIWAVDLDRSEIVNMPRKNIVITPGGRAPSPGDASYIEIQRLRLDCRVYGEDAFEAMSVYRMLDSFMKELRPVVVPLTDHQVYVHNAIPSVGPIALVDPDTDWPSVYATWGVSASEVEIAPSAGVSS